MRLQLRTALIPIIAISLLVLGLRWFLLDKVNKEFIRVEHQLGVINALRAKKAIEYAIFELGSKISDWSQWDNTYAFMEIKDKQYIEETLNPLTISALGFQDVLYFSESNDIWHGVSLQESEAIDPLSETISFFSNLLSKRGENYPSGIAEVGKKLLLYSAAPILPNKGDKPPRGTMVATQLVTPEFLSSIAKLTNLNIEFSVPGEFPEPDDKVETITLQPSDRMPKFEIHSSSKASIYDTIRDSNGKSVLSFRISFPRTIFAQGKYATQTILLLVTLIGVLVCGALIAVLNVFVVRRVQLLTSQVSAIAERKSPISRISGIKDGSLSLSVQTSGCVFAVFSVATIILTLVFNRYILASFEVVEDGQIKSDLVRAYRAIDARTDKLRGKAVDWAQWDDSYQFVKDRNNEYSQANLGYDTLGPMKMNSIIFFNINGEYIDGRVVNTESLSVGPVPTDTIQAIREYTSIVKINDISTLPAGFIKLPTGIVLAAASPILDSARSKPSRGTLIFTSRIDDALREQLAKQTDLKLDLIEIGSDRFNSGETIQRISEDEIVGSTQVLDLAGQTVLQLRVSSPREIYQQGMLISKAIPWYLGIGGTASALITLLCVHGLIITRFNRMMRETLEVEKSGDLSKRVSNSGKDEIGSLANHLNSMLAALEEAKDELVEARDAAESANKAKSVFVAKVSHELRTPMNSIMGMLRILERDEPSTTRRNYIRMAYEAADTLLHTINEILDFSKAESGKMVLEEIEVDIRDLVRSVLRTITPRLDEKPDLEIICRVSRTCPQIVWGDPIRLRQVIVNLLGNAIKFTAKGSIVLSLSCDSVGSLIIEITDTGVGIPSDRLKNIFDPFTQADESVTRMFQGTGLGLTIVKQLIESMGGSIQVESKVNTGSTFVMKIPLRRLALATTMGIKKSGYTHAVIVTNDKVTGCHLNDVLVESGVQVEIIPPTDLLIDNKLSNYFNPSSIIVLSGDACKQNWFLNLCERAIASSHSPLLIPLISASEIALREGISSAQNIRILSYPCILEDILDVIDGDIKDKEEQCPSDMAVPISDRKLKILVADDTYTNRLILCASLTEAGHEVITVEDGLQMLSEIERSYEENISPGFDLILTDVHMPNLDGVSACRKIRESESTGGGQKRIPIIAVTANAFHEEIDRIKLEGIDAVITKPVEPTELAKVISTLTGVKYSFIRRI